MDCKSFQLKEQIQWNLLVYLVFHNPITRLFKFSLFSVSKSDCQIVQCHFSICSTSKSCKREVTRFNNETISDHLKWFRKYLERKQRIVTCKRRVVNVRNSSRRKGKTLSKMTHQVNTSSKFICNFKSSRNFWTLLHKIFQYFRKWHSLHI